MPILIFPLLWIAIAAGRRIDRALLKSVWTQSSLLERWLFGFATGTTLLAYGVLAIGVAGFLYGWAVAVLAAALAAIGWGEHAAMAKELSSARPGRMSPRGAFVALCFVFFAAVALVSCFTPPYPMEWDSLSYHLSDPSIYVARHRIVSLPWESHSNFAFTMEMLYSIGILAHSFALAKLFHFAMGVAATAAVYEAARRLGGGTGLLAALLFASIPLVFWEAGSAYVDLAATAFGALGFVALVDAIERDCPRWLAMTAVMLGCMLSIKATSIFTAALYCGAAGIWLARRAANASQENGAAAVSGLKGAVLVGIVAIAIGCPWYVKSWIVTGNPVYPFAYSVFGGRHWSRENASLYTSNQINFGVGHADPGAHPSLGVDILMAPWNLTMYTLPGHYPPGSSKPNPFNDNPSLVAALSPVFLATLFAPALRRKRLPASCAAALWIALLALVPWAASSQQERYLLPIFPLLCLPAAHCIVELRREKRLAGYAFAAVALASLLLSGVIGAEAFNANAGVAFGRVSVDDFLAQRFPAYGAFQFLNAQPRGSGVVLYGEPLGLYCRQPYMWGEPTHGKVIPYDSLPTPDALRTWLLAHGYRFILWNRSEAPFSMAPPGKAPATWDQKVYALTQTPPVYYNGNPYAPITVYRL